MLHKIFSVSKKSELPEALNESKRTVHWINARRLVALTAFSWNWPQFSTIDRVAWKTSTIETRDGPDPVSDVKNRARVRSSHSTQLRHSHTLSQIVGSWFESHHHRHRESSATSVRGARNTTDWVSIFRDGLGPWRYASNVSSGINKAINSR